MAYEEFPRMVYSTEVVKKEVPVPVVLPSPTYEDETIVKSEVVNSQEELDAKLADGWSKEHPFHNHDGSSSEKYGDAANAGEGDPYGIDKEYVSQSAAKDTEPVREEAFTPQNLLEHEDKPKSDVETVGTTPQLESELNG